MLVRAAPVRADASPVADGESATPTRRPGRAGTIGWARLTWGVARRAIVSPALARGLVRVLWRFRRRLWFVRPPFLPLPSREYVRWRMYTAYGDENAVPPVADLLRYAHWAGRKR
jgi:hypothetical protein